MNFHNIDPIIFEIKPFAITWYSLSYVAGIIFCWIYLKKLTKKFTMSIKPQHIEDFVTWAIIGIVLGGRLGYVLFYQPLEYFRDPITIFKTYDGDMSFRGMSFHGGLLGLVISALLFSRKYKLKFINLADLISICAPIGLFFGRIANFINGELYGRVTEVPWGVIFPYGGELPRHPSQIYEALSEGLLTFLILQFVTYKYRTFKFTGFNTGLFFICYSISRIFIEYFREPDNHIGFILQYFTMGQLLSLPMIIFGATLIYRSRCHLKQEYAN